MEKRETLRQSLRHTAWLAFGPGELHGCKLSDISQAGARIDVEEDVSLPDHFILFLPNNRAARRACRVVWRNERQIGVKFEPRLGTTEPEKPSVKSE
jgi:hypothetical protein